MHRFSLLFLVWLLLVLVPLPVCAQGRGLALGALRKQGTAQPVPPPGGTGVRPFGVWLDDATLPPAGHGWVSISLSHLRTTVFRQTDLPVIDGGLGVTERLQVGGSLPFYHASDPAGGTWRGMGDVYLHAKVGLIKPDPADGTPGLAAVPVLEILADGSSSPDGSRWHWALPVTLELPHERIRVYGAAGYFSRGAVFAGGAVNVPLSHTLVTFGTLTHTYATRADPLSDALDLNRRRTDLAGGVSRTMGGSLSLYGSVGRTISRRDPTSTTFSFSTGLSVGFQRSR